MDDYTNPAVMGGPAHTGYDPTSQGTQATGNEMFKRFMMMRSLMGDGGMGGGQQAAGGGGFGGGAIGGLAGGIGTGAMLAKLGAMGG